jgi:hypothetical protein
MTDHDPNDDAALASAYLDGELDAVEIARVERDPVLRSEVALQRQVRALVADVEAPSIARREEHLAAALEAWDRLPATLRSADGTPVGTVAGAITTPPPSTADRRTAGRSRRLLGAAAALVVLLGAGAALQVFTQIDDDQDDVATEQLAADASRADGAAGDASDDASSDAAESATAVAPDTDEELAVDGTIDVGSDNASPPRENDLEQLRGPDDLAIFASDAIGAPVAGTDGALAESDAGAAVPEIELPLCLGADILVGPALYRDQVVVVGIDLGRNLALAYLPDGCTEVARADVDGP